MYVIIVTRKSLLTTIYLNIQLQVTTAVMYKKNAGEKLNKYRPNIHKAYV